MPVEKPPFMKTYFVPQDAEPELQILSVLIQAVTDLPEEARWRAINYLHARFNGNQPF